MNDYTFTKGDVEESLSIMREAAQWLIDKGCPLWDVNGLTQDKMNNSPEEFIVMWDSSKKSVATLLLSYEDKFFWSDIPANTSGFIAKVSVRRAFAGKGLANQMIDFAIKECKSKGIKMLRLDCDANREKLCSFYENIGFCFNRIKTIKTSHTKSGVYNAALYEMKI